MRGEYTRRTFIIGSMAALAGCATSRRVKPARRRVSPNEKLNIACIGVGGQGASDVMGVGGDPDAGIEGENIVALCDVDDERAAPIFAKFPKATRYRDFRVLLEKEKSIDAVTISTPDHMHAPIAMAAMQLGKHVYVQKPMARTIQETRVMTQAARRYGVVTQMGNQGHSGDGVRLLCEIIWSGMIGQVREVIAISDRPIWPQGLSRPAGEDPVPPSLDWDLWLGGAPYRPYVHRHPETKAACYCPFVWRGWWDFGAGALGDMGCHILDAANWALKLGAPVSVEATRVEGASPDGEMAPRGSVLKYQFPAREDMPPVTLTWHDGGMAPVMPEGIDPRVRIGDGRNGLLFLGDKDLVTTDCYAGSVTLTPTERMKDFRRPPRMLDRVPKGNHYRNWVDACKGGAPACSHFDYAGPFTETVLLGNLALRAGKKIEWDSQNMRVLNAPEADAFVRSTYRAGWSV
ncbi:MAG TPA: Gfo/Idh/MocA family oxidoreductase [Candidatus Hydrogenedentes bacterium]|nr:Gfo/Idh/MocA family oxidoreductase [Candidatus Hydrogenedentota bacterium]HOS02953.1 Gfo/Idh/MocA family oxidoreductase [Candidatus Hydrogenedentota bacterium]